MGISRSSMRTKPIRWLEAKVIIPDDCFVIRRRSEKRPAMRVSFEHLNLVSRSKLAKEMMSVSLEDEMKSNTITDLRKVQEMKKDANSAFNIVTDLVQDIFRNNESLECRDILSPIGSKESFFSDRH